MKKPFCFTIPSENKNVCDEIDFYRIIIKELLENIDLYADDCIVNPTHFSLIGESAIVRIVEKRKDFQELLLRFGEGNCDLPPPK